MQEKMMKVFLLLILSSILSASREIVAKQFLFLDLSSQQILQEIEKQLRKIDQSPSESPLYQAIHPIITSNGVMNKKLIQILVNIVSRSQELTLIMFQNFSLSRELRIFQHVETLKLKQEILEAISKEILLANLFANQFFLKQKGKMHILIKTLFGLKSNELNDILLRNIDLQFFVSQRCVLSRFPFLRRLQDSKNKSLTRQQKYILIPLILQQNSAWQQLLKDQKPAPF